MSLVRFSNQLPSMFDRFFEGDLFDWSNNNFSMTNTTLPSVNIKENSDEFKVEVAAPGFEKRDFKLELDHDVLTISSEKQIENERNEDERYSKREFVINHLPVHLPCLILPIANGLMPLMIKGFCL